VHFSFKGLILSLGLVLLSAMSLSVFAQTSPTATPSASPAATPATVPAVVVAQPTPQGKPDKNVPQVFTADQIAEATILINGSRNGMNQIKRTTFERGKLTVSYPDGSSDNATYEKRIIRGETTDKDKWRLDQKYPSVEYSMIFNTKIVGVMGGQVFSPRQEALNNFEAQIWHSMDTLFRYKENGSKLELSEKQKNLGVEYYLLDVIDKSDRKTRFFISTKSLKILAMEYEMGGIKYSRKFYDYRPAQGLLVPYRTVLYANDKQVEETWILTITYGQKIEGSYFDES
jgi:hypothetical protein